MSKIPTAEEMVDKWQTEALENMGTQNADVNSLENAFIEFAKLHVEAALKAASENATASNKAKFKGDCNPQVDENSILNSYSLDKIK